MQLSQGIAFIGAGNMASALVQGLIAAGTCAAERIAVTDLHEAATRELAQRYGVRAASENRSAARAAQVVVLCVKPQVMPEVLRELAHEIGTDKLTLSIAAGVPISVLERPLPHGARVVRAMPNTPALVQAG